MGDFYTCAAFVYLVFNDKHTHHLNEKHKTHHGLLNKKKLPKIRS